MAHQLPKLRYYVHVAYSVQQIHVELLRCQTHFVAIDLRVSQSLTKRLGPTTSSGRGCFTLTKSISAIDFAMDAMN